MTALAANKGREAKRLGNRVRYLMANSTTIWQGSLVMLNSSLLATPAAATAGNFGCVGWATEKKISGTGGDDWIIVQEGDVYLTGVTLSQTDVLLPVFGEDDDQVDNVQAANEPRAGLLIEYVSASKGLVRMCAGIVAGQQGAAITDPTGGATIDAEARTAIIAINDRLQALGFIR